MNKNLIRVLFLVLVSAIAMNGASSPMADDKNEAIQNFRAGCMEATDNEPFCACMANALQSHAPAEHIRKVEHGVEFSEEMPQEAHHDLTKAAKACQEKFDKPEE